MFRHLEHIYDPRERMIVGLADLGLSALTLPARARRRSPATAAPERILLFRLERIGDLLMTLGALESVRATWPQARVDLVVGSWNDQVARQLPWVDRVLTFDAPWLSRGGGRVTPRRALAHVRAWRHERYDLAVNLEGDIRSNVLLGLSGAPVRIGFPMAGGGAALTHAVRHDPRAHTDENTRRLVREAALLFGTRAIDPEPRWPRFPLPESAERAAHELVGDAFPAGRSLIGLHTGGGREIKQWPPQRFGQAVGALARAVDACVVLTGSASDQPLVEAARAALPAGLHVIDSSGRLDLLALAAVLRRLALYVTGDTGPMHLAAAMGAPVVAVFGVSDPARYAPLTPRRRIVRIDLPCSPCNRVRLPPERCRGVVPDCLAGIGADAVTRAGLSLLDEAHAGACA